MNQSLEMMSNLQRKNFVLKVRHDGPQPSIFVRRFRSFTTTILGAVLALGPLKEEDYMRLVKVSMERKEHLVGINGCEHTWPCFGKPAIIFHDRGKIFTSERRPRLGRRVFREVDESEKILFAC